MQMDRRFGFEVNNLLEILHGFLQKVWFSLMQSDGRRKMSHRNTSLLHHSRWTMRATLANPEVKSHFLPGNIQPVRPSELWKKLLDDEELKNSRLCPRCSSLRQEYNDLVLREKDPKRNEVRGQRSKAALSLREHRAGTGCLDNRKVDSSPFLMNSSQNLFRISTDVVKTDYPETKFPFPSHLRNLWMEDSRMA
jgi:hypothetical protein